MRWGYHANVSNPEDLLNVFVALSKKMFIHIVLKCFRYRNYVNKKLQNLITNNLQP